MQAELKLVPECLLHIYFLEKVTAISFFCVLMVEKFLMPLKNATRGYLITCMDANMHGCRLDMTSKELILKKYGLLRSTPKGLTTAVPRSYSVTRCEISRVGNGPRWLVVSGCCRCIIEQVKHTVLGSTATCF